MVWPAWLAMLAVLMGSLGPLVPWTAIVRSISTTIAGLAKASSASHAGDERYPCENCACGCGSALECWTACCCHTPHERLVWALANGVKPPAALEVSASQWARAAADLESRQARAADASPTTRGKAQAACPLCKHDDADSPKADGTLARGSCENGALDLARVSMGPLSCKGLASHGNPASFGALWIPLETRRAAFEPVRVECVLLVAEFPAPSRTLDTPTPPPRATSPVRA